MLSLHNVATAIVLMVVHTLVSTHPNILKADLQDREASAVGWQKAFEGGRCDGNNWLRGHDESTQSQCQEACSSEDDCEFYCHSTTPPGFHWECLRYKGCPSMNTTLHGSDASSYSCYKKPDCCDEIVVDVSSSDSRLKNFNGVWKVHSSFNGRPMYSKGSSAFLFYTEKDGPKRWVLEDVIGKTGHYGFIRYEGDNNCPGSAGERWSHVWNKNVIDTSIKVHCQNVVCEDKAVLDTFCPSMKSLGLCNEEFYQDYCAKTCGAC